MNNGLPNGIEAVASERLQREKDTFSKATAARHAVLHAMRLAAQRTSQHAAHSPKGARVCSKKKALENI